MSADFDAIYEDEQDDQGDGAVSVNDLRLVPDPIVIQGAGNMTV